MAAISTRRTSTSCAPNASPTKSAKCASKLASVSASYGSAQPAGATPNIDDAFATFTGSLALSKPCVVAT